MAELAKHMDEEQEEEDYDENADEDFSPDGGDGDGEGSSSEEEEKGFSAKASKKAAKRKGELFPRERHGLLSAIICESIFAPQR